MVEIMDSVKLKINESNQVKFKLHIQGTTSEPGAQDPEFRFVLSEQDDAGKNTIGFVFPVKKEENGTVSVVIPAMEGTLKENKNYLGKMEVLMGSRYFTPSTLQISFEKEFRITAEPIVEKSQVHQTQQVKESLQQQASVTTEYVSVASKPTVSVPTVTKNNNQPPVRQTNNNVKLSLTMEEIKRVNGDEKKLKRLIAENLSKQVSPKSPNFVALVESTFDKVKEKFGSLVEANKKQNNKAAQQKHSSSSESDDNESYDVEDLMGMIWKDGKNKG